MGTPFSRGPVPPWVLAAPDDQANPVFDNAIPEMIRLAKIEPPALLPLTASVHHNR